MIKQEFFFLQGSIELLAGSDLIRNWCAWIDVKKQSDDSFWTGIGWKTSVSPTATLFEKPPLKLVFLILLWNPRPALCDYTSDASFPDALSVSLFHLLSRWHHGIDDRCAQVTHAFPFEESFCEEISPLGIQRPVLHTSCVFYFYCKSLKRPLQRWLRSKCLASSTGGPQCDGIIKTPLWAGGVVQLCLSFFFFFLTLTQTLIIPAADCHLHLVCPGE